MSTQTQALHGIYANTLYRNQQNGYTVFALYPEEKIIPLNKFGTITCTGYCVPFTNGMPIYATGTYKKDRTSGVFTCESIKEDYQTRKTMISFLKYAFNGIGEKTAETIVDKHGTNLSNLLNNPNAASYLSESVKGINKDRAEKIIRTLRNTSAQRQVFEFIAPFGGTYHDSCKIYEEYGAESIKKMKANPYCITQVGVSFTLADNIAKKMNKGAADQERIDALIDMIDEIFESGDTYIYQEEIYNYMNKFLTSSQSAFQRKLPLTLLQTGLTRSKKYFLDTTSTPARIYPRKLYQAEKNIVREIKRLEKTAQVLDFTPDIVQKVEEMCGINYAPPQQNSFHALEKTGVKIITGGPGTGKTTTIRGILTAYQMMYPDNVIKLCAPTGRAAQRMSESTDMEAVTIHRLLDFRPYGNNVICKDDKNPIEADLIVVDEMSMTDTLLMASLLRAVKDGTLLLLVGDIYQLPSVGPGDVLHDLIFCKKLPVFRLTKVYRQAGDSPIVTNANLINEGRTDLITCEDFEIITVKNDEECKEKILELTKKYYDKDDPFKMQILSPSKKYEAGTRNINEEIQKIVNPKTEGFTFGSITYKVGDKIILLNNNYECGYYNGDVGEVTEITSNGVFVDILGTTLRLKRGMMEDLNLAYDVTVHKSQGSEYPIAICALPENPGNMLARNLLYTAVTRAKKKVIIVATEGSLTKAVKNNKTGKRKTSLMELMAETEF